jgi:16S rRNA (cytidine1402-2'-O)-methyltransferase
VSIHSDNRGVLYLVPTPLDFGIAQDTPAPAGQWLPTETLSAASRLTHWITENAKSTRAFLKRVETVAGLAAPLQAQHITELPRAAHKKRRPRPANRQRCPRPGSCWHRPCSDTTWVW